MAKANRDSNTIELLDDFEFVMLRPHIYVGAIEPTDTKIYRVNRDGTITYKSTEISIALYKLFNEIFDNSLDIHKKDLRSNPKKECWIKIVLDERDNSITVEDNGSGFEKSWEIHKKSNMTNVETAFVHLKAGSNFRNDTANKTNSSILGTHGMGGAITNMLSDYFEVKTVNKSSSFTQKWEKFRSRNKPTIAKGGAYKNTGTKITFIPREDKFSGLKYDRNIIYGDLSIKAACLASSKLYDKIKIEYDVIDVNGKRESQIIYEPSGNGYMVFSDNFTMMITQRLPETTNLLVVNSTICEGSILKYVIDDIVFPVFKSPNAANYFNVTIFCNLTPEFAIFGDQNKAKYGLPKNKITKLVDAFIGKQMFQFNKSETFVAISKAIEDGEHRKAVDSLARDKKKNNRVISKKYFQPSKVKKELFIVEGDSAAGPLIRSRNSETQGVYALKGKILNCAKASDIKSNEEIMDLVTILNLDFNTAQCSYERIIIATDADPDGYHICAQLINLFRWFKPVVDLGKLHIIKVPLFCVQTGSQKQYFYDLKDLHKYKNPIYLKGLGALMEEDWEKVMQNRQLSRVVFTEKSMSYIDMAFNEKSDVRKRWLTDKNCVK